MRSWQWMYWVLGLGLLTTLSSAAQTPSQRQQGPETPQCTGEAALLDVTADRMTFNQQTRTFLFEQNVHVQRCDMTIRCDQLQVMHAGTDKDVERVVATGNVRIQQGTQHAVAARAEYFPPDQRLVLTGNPRIWDTKEQHEVRGDEIVIALSQEQMAVKRAHARFHPQSTPAKAP